MDKIRVIDRTNIEQDAKIYVISDPHGAYDLFKKATSDIDLVHDYLFILGDIASKGKDGLKLLDYVIELSRNPHVSVIMGNCDRADCRSLNEDHLEWFQKIIHSNWLVGFLARKTFNGQVPMLGLDECRNLQKQFKEEYQYYFDFLTNLPHVILTDKYLFSHAGISHNVNFNNDDLEKYVRNYTFYDDGHYYDKIVICGHMPSAIYQKTQMNYDILYNPLKRIMLLDGGMNVAIGGQLNRLTIEHDEFIYNRYEDYEEYYVLVDQVAPSYMKGPFWPDFQIEVLQRQPYFSLCLNKKTLEISLIKNELIIDVDGHNEVSGDCVGSFINVRKGDIIKMVQAFDGYSLVKKEGILGWLDNQKIGDKHEN